MSLNDELLNAWKKKEWDIVLEKLKAGASLAEVKKEFIVPDYYHKNELGNGVKVGKSMTLLASICGDHLKHFGKIPLIKYILEEKLEKFCKPSASIGAIKPDIFRAVESGDFDLVKYLIEEHKVDLNTKYRGRTLYEFTKNEEIIDLLKKNGGENKKRERDEGDNDTIEDENQKKKPKTKGSNGDFFTLFKKEPSSEENFKNFTKEYGVSPLVAVNFTFTCLLGSKEEIAKKLKILTAGSEFLKNEENQKYCKTLLEKPSLDKIEKFKKDYKDLPTKILGISFSEEDKRNPIKWFQETVNPAYKGLSKKYHPDLNGGDGSKMVAFNEAKDLIESNFSDKFFIELLFRQQMEETNKLKM